MDLAALVVLGAVLPKRMGPVGLIALSFVLIVSIVSAAIGSGPLGIVIALFSAALAFSAGLAVRAMTPLVLRRGRPRRP